MVPNANNKSSKVTVKSVATRFLEKPVTEQRKLLRTLFWVGLIRFVMFFLPFRQLRKLIEGRPKIIERSSTEFREIKGDNRVSIIKEIVSSVETVSRYVPWESKCLVKACSAKILLKKHGISSYLCLGVKSSGFRDKGNEDSVGEMNPHAWLVVDSEVVLGGENLEKYVKVSEF